MFIVIEHENAQSPGGAAWLTHMSLLRSFGFLAVPYYKHAAPPGLGNALYRSADFQSAVSRISNPQTVPKPAPKRNRGLPIGNRRYSRLETCATKGWRCAKRIQNWKFSIANFQLTGSCAVLCRTFSLLLCFMVLLTIATTARSSEHSFGPAYHEFGLTLAPGHRTEALGPLWYAERKESARLWAVPPIFSYTLDEETDFAEFDFAYPVITYDRFGSEYRFHIFQLLSFAGGRTQSETNVSRFTLFPLYFQQRSAIPEKNYTAVIPFYGHLKNRLFRDEVNFVMLPIYVQSRKRDVVTDNYVYPFVHSRRGNGLKGWQVWPLTGHEHKVVTTRTNIWGETDTSAGHDKFFVLWPLFFNQTTGIGTTNPVHQQVLLPLYSRLRSPQRDSTRYLWPLGITHTVDREKKYIEWGTPWPLIVFDRGEGKTTSRVWPLFSQSHTATLESDWYLWLVYKFNRINSAPLDRRRTRILFFLYSDIIEKNTETGAALRRSDFWPLFTVQRDFDGSKRLQVLAPLEPFLPNNKSIERDYSPVWSLWRSEKNAKTGAASQSLIWNLYRRDAAPESRKYSLLFGLFQYQSSAAGKRWRVLYIPFG